MKSTSATTRLSRLPRWVQSTPCADIQRALARPPCRQFLERLCVVTVREELSESADCHSVPISTVQMFMRPRGRGRDRRTCTEFYVHLVGPLQARGETTMSRHASRDKRQASLEEMSERERWLQKRLGQRAHERDGHVSLKLWLYYSGNPQELSLGGTLHCPLDFMRDQRVYMRGQYLCFIARERLMELLEAQVTTYRTCLVEVDHVYGFGNEDGEHGWRTRVPFVFSCVNILRNRLRTDVLEGLFAKIPMGAYIALPGVLEYVQCGQRLLRSGAASNVNNDGISCVHTSSGLLRHVSLVSEHLTQEEIRMSEDLMQTNQTIK